MGVDLETRLLIPFLEYLRTDPVVVNYKIFSRSCAEILFFISFLLINSFILRCFIVTTWRQNETNNIFHESLLRLLTEELGDVEDDEDDKTESESNQLDENGNELETATESIGEIEIGGFEGLNNDNNDDEISKL